MPSKKVSKKTSKKTASKKATPVPTPKVVVAAAAPAAPATAAATPATKEVATPTLGDQFTALLAQLSAFRSQLTSVTAQVRALNKRSDRELKQALKAGRKKRKSGNRAPSGFVKPTKISMELANFLGKEKGTEMARTEVTREINTYIRAHKLQDPKNGRRILADAKLRKLLKLKKEDELTYFNLQRYMSPHFAKAGKKLPESA
jgi:chromatin remodeling complex protein RSC6|tara:strand:- start:5265 stop:5873 length:609 start_codon:yes stop_codon:yes gene_type:complete